MKRFIQSISKSFIDVQMGIIRAVIFSYGFTFLMGFGMGISFFIASAVSLCLIFIDRSFFFNQEIEFDLKGQLIKKTPKIILRIALALVYGLFSGFIIARYLKDGMAPNDLTNKGDNNLFLITAVIWILFELIYMMSKNYLNRKESSIAKKYSSFIKLFNDHYMPVSQKEKFILVLASLENQRAEFNHIRVLMENILLRFTDEDLNLLPNSFLNKRSLPNLENSIAYIGNQKEIFPDHIHYSFWFIKNTCSAFSHTTPARPGDYLNESCVYALLECLHFLKMKVDNKI